MKDKELYSHFASVLHVHDIEKSIYFYTAQLGFELTFSWKDPIDYAVLKRGTVSIHLSGSRHEVKPPEGITLYIFVHDIEAVYQECLKNKVSISAPLGERDYGMKDFDVTDPDGYQICFGKGSVNQ